MAKKKTKKATEKAIETAILTYLNYLPKCFAWKNNSIGVYDARRGCYRKSKGKFAINGVSDILGIYNGRLLAIEVKRDKSSVVSEEQEDFINRVNKEGGIAGVCWTLEQVKELLNGAGKGNTKGVSE